MAYIFDVSRSTPSLPELFVLSGEAISPSPHYGPPTVAWSPSLWTSAEPKEPTSSYHCDPSRPTTVTDALIFDAKMT